jgi:glycosyltransferase involved in cell wall biosynthesis
VRFLGPVDKATAEALYRESDVFLFPTLSDGFGLTQLEALGAGLPVIASRNCGAAVEHGVSGIVLPEVIPEILADEIMKLLNGPDELRASLRLCNACSPLELAARMTHVAAECGR